LRRDIVALVVYDQVLLAIGNGNAALVINMTNIAGVQPAINDNAIGFGLIAPLSLHHQRSAHQYFAILGDFDFRIFQRRTNGVHFDASAWPVAANDRAGLGLTIALQHSDTQGLEKHADVGVQRRAAGHHCFHPAAKARLDFWLDCAR
jgi:hypothetical protein